MNQTNAKPKEQLAFPMKNRPAAVAKIKGSREFNHIYGEVAFYNMDNGTLLVSRIHGLPIEGTFCSTPIFAMHIHENGDCTDDTEEPFPYVGPHYNPVGCEHPYHAGDLPPLFADKKGFAYSAVYTARFKVNDVIGRSVILHSQPDDFTSQPAGNSGKKIACGAIVSTCRICK